MPLLQSTYDHLDIKKKDHCNGLKKSKNGGRTNSWFATIMQYRATNLWARFLIKDEKIEIVNKSIDVEKN